MLTDSRRGTTTRDKGAQDGHATGRFTQIHHTLQYSHPQEIEHIELLLLIDSVSRVLNSHWSDGLRTNVPQQHSMVTEHKHRLSMFDKDG